MAASTDIYFPSDLPSPFVSGSYDKDPQSYDTLMESGRLRRRQRFTTPLMIRSVEWIFEDDQFSTFVDFFENFLEDGTLNFLISFGNDTTYDEVNFYTASYSVNVRDGFRVVQAQLVLAGASAAGPSVPATPTSLSATAITYAEIDLTWTDNATTETGYKVQRKTGVGGTWATIDTIAAGSTSYSDTTVSQGTTYYYRVYAYNDAGPSGYSNEANATTPSFGPDQTNLEAWFAADYGVTYDGSNNITAWADETGNGHDCNTVGAINPVYYPDYFGSGIPACYTTGQQTCYFDMDTAFNPSTGDWTAVMMCDPVTLSLGQMLGATSGSNQWSLQSGPKMFVYPGNIFSAAFTWTNPAMVVIRRTSNAYTFRINKTNLTGGSSGTSMSLQRISMGGAGGAGFKGYIGEVLLYSRYLSDADLVDLYDNYLRVKYPTLPAV